MQCYKYLYLLYLNAFYILSIKFKYTLCDLHGNERLCIHALAKQNRGAPIKPLTAT